MKLLEAPHLKTRALTKAISTAIHRYGDEAFDDMREESEKNKNILSALSSINHCGLFQLKAWLSRSKNLAASDPSELSEDTPKDPREQGGQGSLDKGYN